MLERLLTSNVCYTQAYGPDGNEYDPRFVTKLKINYRSVPSVLQLYNKLFYNSELQGAISGEESPDTELLRIIELKKNKKISNCGIHFYNVAKGVNKREKDSSSWFNPTEVNAVCSYISWMQRQVDVDIPFKDIGVVSSFFSIL